MTTINRIGVIGAGAWGTALTKHLAEKGMAVTLWAYEQEVVDTIKAIHENSLYLPGVVLPASVIVTNKLVHAVQGCDGLLFVVPSHVARPVLQNLAPLLDEKTRLLSATKGVEEGTFKLMTEVMEELLPASVHGSLSVLFGHSLGRQGAPGQPAASCLAGKNSGTVEQFQTAFMTSTLRVYADSDLIGVQLGGSLKNVIALAAGVVDGLGLGYNSRAALITRG